MTRILLVVLAAITAGTVGVATRGSDPVATIGTDAISREEWLARLAALRSSAEMAVALKPMTPAGRAQVLAELIDERLFARAGHDDGLERDPAVKAAIDRATRAIVAEAYLTRLADAPITSAAIRAYYDAHKAEFVTARRAKARHIVLGTHEHALQALADLRNGADFATLAAERSTDRATKDAGGQLGWIPRGVMTPAFEQALFALRPGQLSGIVETRFGFHVIRLDEVEEPATPSLQAVEDDIRSRMRAERRSAARDRLATKYRVTIDSELLTSPGK